LNYIALGNVYYNVLPLGVTNAYESSKEQYNKALELNPKNPMMLLLLAKLEITNKNIPQAKAFLVQALEMKNDYVDAIILSAQIDESEGNLSGAMSKVEKAVMYNPSNFDARYYLGIIYQKLGKNKVKDFMEI